MKPHNTRYFAAASAAADLRWAAQQFSDGLRVAICERLVGGFDTVPAEAEALEQALIASHGILSIPEDEANGAVDDAAMERSIFEGAMGAAKQTLINGAPSFSTTFSSNSVSRCCGNIFLRRVSKRLHRYSACESSTGA